MPKQTQRPTDEEIRAIARELIQALANPPGDPHRDITSARFELSPFDEDRVIEAALLELERKPETRSRRP